MRPYARLAAPALAAALVLSACSGSSSSSELPEVTGAFGEKPKVTVAEDASAGGKLRSEVLSEGDGPEVGRGDLLVADYLGKNFRSGDVFDNSYDRGAPAAFPLKSGPGGVISGWVKSLSGVPVGSRVLLVAPPKDGYGKAGNEQAGIRGKDSLVFVVDLIAAYDSKADLPASTPVSDLATTLPTAEGTTDPTLTVPEGAEPPTEPVTTVVATGDGEDVERGKLVVVHYTAVSWANEPLSSTWSDLPQGVQVGTDQPSPFDLLVGTPVGSRVVLELPAQTGADPETESVAVVIDVLGQHGAEGKGAAE